MSNFDLKFLTLYFTTCAGIVSHLLLFVCLAKDPLKCFRNTASYFVTSLALADFALCTWGMISLAFGDEIQSVFHIFQTSFALASFFSILSIALDRYILTVHPFKHRVILDGKAVAIWIASIWLLSLCHLVIRFILGPNIVDKKIYLVTFIVVALLSGLIYLLTYVSLRRHERHISEQNQCQNRSLQREFLKTIFIVAIVQIITIIPANIYALVEHLLSYLSNHEKAVVEVVIIQLYFLNFAINPFLYMWRLKNYRRTFCLLFCRETR